MTIRIATIEDLDQLVAFAKSLFIDTYEHLNNPTDFQAYLNQAFAKEQFQLEMGQPDSTFLIVEEEGNWLGYFKINLNVADGGLPPSECLELERIYVEPQQRGRGIGKKMIQRAIEIGKVHGKQYLWLGVWQRNPAAIAFYEKVGFLKFGTHIFTIGADDQIDDLMYLEISNPLK